MVYLYFKYNSVRLIDKMLTYSKFGYNGRLGNQMFQFATIYSLAKKNNLPFILPKIKHLNEYQSINEFFLFSLNEQIHNSFIEMEKYQIIYNDLIHQKFIESSFSYKDITFDKTQNIDIGGYFQSEKYFKEYKKDIIDLYSPAIKSQKYFEIEKNVQNNKTISLHVRRGDYLNKSTFHTNLSDTDYYKKAMKIFSDTENYLVFSDDIAFCKKYFYDLKNVLFVEGLNSVEELWLQSKCYKNIIANSSFSWWGAWLKENSKDTIAPLKWFGIDGPKDTLDLYPSDWILI